MDVNETQLTAFKCAINIILVHVIVWVKIVDCLLNVVVCT
jgi:hypothetical protein